MSLPSMLLVGCGKMGGALVEGMKDKEKPFSVVLDRHTDRDKLHGFEVVRSVNDLDSKKFKPDVVVLAIKPQNADEVISQVADRYPDATVLSVMAGITVSYLGEKWNAVVRAMPNTPSQIKAGVCGLYASNATDDQKEYCEIIMSAVGKVRWVDDEKLIDVVTAISGSGPAYLFLLAEFLETAGKSQGLPDNVARRLSREVIYKVGDDLCQEKEEALSCMLPLPQSKKEDTFISAAGLWAAGWACVRLLAEFLETAGKEQGLSDNVACFLPKETVYGAGLMLDTLEEDASKLRANVTCPKGTTEAALKVLEESGFKRLVFDAVEKAVHRSKELGRSYHQENIKNPVTEAALKVLKESGFKRLVFGAVERAVHRSKELGGSYH